VVDGHMHLEHLRRSRRRMGWAVQPCARWWRKVELRLHHSPNPSHDFGDDSTVRAAVQILEIMDHVEQIRIKEGTHLYMCHGGISISELWSILSLDPCCAVQIHGETGTTHSLCSTRYSLQQVSDALSNFLTRVPKGTERF
jgi:hypothetical protein